MDIDLSMQMLAARTAATSNSLQVAIVKKSHEMQTELLETLMQTALSAPPPGQGTKVDKLA
ncbi:hypothetical protein [Devosia chinhatensis]|uniref:Motility protein n=1 Tax=Devosia chinhatensis TaxID=429727 RepID=A0A0F5FFW9_9HYPH|nr:hypothetical protein [Devosia chinhatensis]KKB07678.1 hypothetical protein VE26_13445 [Devosia chinhatensis]